MSFVTGVYKDHTCSHKVNHGVLVVGYGTEDGEDYWLVKNRFVGQVERTTVLFKLISPLFLFVSSWGERYGDGGYIKMARNRHNQCGIALYACFPVM